MSTGANGNGITEPDAYTSRTKTWAAGQQVASADLNTIQDGIIDVSEAVDDLAAETGVSRICSGNQGDSPAPTPDGGGVIWIEMTTNGTTDVVVDDSIDWRDRVIVAEGLLLGETPYSANMPGGANDDDTDYDLTGSGSGEIHRILYTEAGQDGTNNNPAVAVVRQTDEVRLFARDTDGKLCLVKNGTSDSYETIFWGCVKFSPDQGHQA